MDKKAYNLKRTFEQPIVFYEFTDNFELIKVFELIGLRHLRLSNLF